MEDIKMGAAAEAPWGDLFMPKAFDEESSKCLLSLLAAYVDLANLLQLALPSGRQKSLVLTHLEDSAMHATKALSHR